MDPVRHESDHEFPAGWTIKCRREFVAGTRGGAIYVITAEPPAESPFTHIEACIELGIKPTWAGASQTFYSRFAGTVEDMGKFFDFAYRGCRSLPGEHHVFGGDPSDEDADLICHRCHTRKPKWARLFGVNHLTGALAVADGMREFLARDAAKRPARSPVGVTTCPA